MMEGQLLSDLKVADLRRELEKRCKDKSGVKQVLIDRLREALEENGEDPLTYRFGGNSDIRVSKRTSEKQAVNGDIDNAPQNTDIQSPGVECKDSPVVESMESNTDEPKKLADDSVPYVVQVGDQEEDLDYDLKTDDQETTEDQKPNVSDNADQTSGMSTNVEENGDPEARRNLWVSNLPRTVKAADLKQHFSKAGKVLSATVAMSTKSPGGCFGFLQMNTAEDAAKAVQVFNGTEYDGFKLTVEATDKKPPTLAYKPSERGLSSRSKLSSTRVGSRRPLPMASRYAYRRRIYGARWDRSRAAPASLGRPQTLRDNRRPLERTREPPPSALRPPRINPSVLAYQSLKRASRLIAASRYGMIKRLQAMQQNLSARPYLSRVAVSASRMPLRYNREGPMSSRRHPPLERGEPRRLMRTEPPLRRPSPPPLRRPDPRDAYLSERHRRSMELYRTERPSRPAETRLMPPPPRRSEPLLRRTEQPRPRPPPSPVDRRRWSQPSPGMRPPEPTARYSSDGRPDRYSTGSREFARPSDPIRSRHEQRSVDRMDHSRSPRMPLNNEARRISSPQTAMHYSQRFKPITDVSAPRRSPVQPPLSSPKAPMQYRRDYREVSRSPPRSRAQPMNNRQYTDYSQPRIERVVRDRSPLRAPVTSIRPKVVDYGHRSEPRTSWPPYRNESPAIPTPPGHTWKPAGNTMVSNYPNRNATRRYM